MPAAPFVRRSQGLYWLETMAENMDFDDSYLRGLDAVDSHEEEVSEDDRRQILRQIDILAAPRSASSADKIEPRSRGLLLPVLVPLLAVAAMGAAVVLAQALLGSRQEELARDIERLLAGEGRVLDEYRRESEAKIAQKDAVIFRVLGELESLENERRELAKIMDQRVRRREQELDREKDAALARQREQLLAQGVAAQEAERRLGEIAADLAREAAAELEAYRGQAGALARSRDQELLKQRELAKAVLDTAEAEAAREAARNGEPGDEAEPDEQTAEAQEWDRLVVEGISRSYASVTASIREGDYRSALSGLAALETLLRDSTLDALATVGTRRRADLGVVEALVTYVREKLAAEGSTAVTAAAAPPPPPVPQASVPRLPLQSGPPPLRILGMVSLVEGPNLVIESLVARGVREGFALEIRRPSGAGASSPVARARVTGVAGQRILARVEELVAESAPAVSDHVYLTSDPFP